MTTVNKNIIYDILVRELEAPESIRDSFIRNFPECREFRFQGRLGFGGKIWCDSNGYVYVNCYPEDSNRDRQLMMLRVNQLLIHALNKEGTN